MKRRSYRSRNWSVALFLLSKIRVISKIFEFGIFIIFILGTGSLAEIIESRYEPK